MSNNEISQELVDIEFDVIGILLSNPSKASVGTSGLDPDFMITDFGRIVYREILDLIGKQKDPDTATVISGLSSSGKIKAAGGRAKILRASREAGDFESIGTYIDHLREYHLLREIRERADVISSKGSVDEAAVDVELLREKLQKSRVTYKAQTVASLLPTVQQEIADMQDRSEDSAAYGIPTGFAEIDNILVWLAPGDYVLIAGRPSMGKTAMAVCLARNAAFMYRKRVGIISIEMNSRSLVLRLLCADARIDLTDIRKGKLDSDDIDRLAESFNRFREIDDLLVINDSVKDFRDVDNAIDVMFTVHDCDMVILDYLQNVSKAPGNNKYEQVTNTSQMLQGKKKKYPDKIVVALAQLRRPDGGGGKTKKNIPRPGMDDLKGSGDLEQDADTIILIHRPEKYKIFTENGVSTRGLAEVIIEKQRNGAVGIAKLKFVEHYGLFESKVGT